MLYVTVVVAHPCISNAPQALHLFDVAETHQMAAVAKEYSEMVTNRSNFCKRHHVRNTTEAVASR
jgi:hypothetical protein